MKYQPIIGLEIHLQPKTKSKMFCGCDARYFGAQPNTHTCPVCLGLPGALPVPNERAIELCIKMALALNCDVAEESKFDRKNYFYPDLPKGYQISQYDQPVGEKGYLETDVNGDSKRFRITRVHMEEDTGKSVHVDDKTLLDFNKSGVPLIEIVTEPDFTSKEEVDSFAKRLRQTIRYCDISDADMEKGQMRYELNISLSAVGSRQSKDNVQLPSTDYRLPSYKVEVKNIGSISVLQKVIDFEIKRQSKILDSGETPKQETRGLKDMSGETLGQRTKEGSADYRYFPEPDIPPLYFDKKMVDEIQKEIPELPQEKKLRYIKEYSLDPSLSDTLVSTKVFYKYFEETIESLSKKEKASVQKAGKIIVGQLKGLTNKKKVQLDEIRITPKVLANFIKLSEEKGVKDNVIKKLIVELFKTGGPVEKIVEEGANGGIDEEELNNIVQRVVKDNPKIAEDYRGKNPNAIKYFLGQVMRETKGQADPVLTRKLLEKELGR